MKISMTVAAALLLGSFSATLAAESVDPTIGTIDAQIEAIQQAAPQERHRLMNRFKERIATMNEQERADAIARLRKQMGEMEQERTQTRTQERVEEGEGEQIRSQTRTQNRMDATIQMQQMQQNQQMNRQTGTTMQGQGGKR